MNTKYKVLIIEDEEPAKALILKYLNEFSEFEISAIATNGKEAELYLSNNTYDLIFLDINMPSKNGIDIIKNKSLNKSVIIFSTALDSFALKAFDLGAQDYLLKPYSFPRFKVAIQKSLRILRKNSIFLNDDLSYVNFSSKYVKHRIHHSEIQFISANNYKSILHCLEKDYEVNELLSRLLDRLPKSTFIRIHKSYAVNKYLISSIFSSIEGNSVIKLSNEDETILPVGKKFKSEIKSFLTNQ